MLGGYGTVVLKRMCTKVVVSLALRAADKLHTQIVRLTKYSKISINPLTTVTFSACPSPGSECYKKAKEHRKSAGYNAKKIKTTVKAFTAESIFKIFTPLVPANG